MSTATGAFESILAASQRCTDQQLVSLREPFGSMLQDTPARLAQLPGSPASVMLAQTLSYLKSNFKLREPLLGESKAFSNLQQIVLSIPPKKG